MASRPAGTAPDANRAVLIVGADGMIGRQLMRALKAEGRTVWASTRRQTKSSDRTVFLDLEQPVWQCPSSLANLQAAVLCAGSTSIEQCRLNPASTRRVNVTNTVSLARQLVDQGAFVVFLSSNAVFDGLTAFSRIGDDTNPQTEYGRQKVEAEQQLLDLGGQVAIVRFSKILPRDMPLFKGWAGELRAGKIIRPISTGVIAPVSVAFAATVIGRVLQYRASGYTQVSATHDVSYAQVAKYIANKIQVNIELVQPMHHLSNRNLFFPKNTTLDGSRLREFGIDIPSPTEALEQLELTEYKIE